MIKRNDVPKATKRKKDKPNDNNKCVEKQYPHWRFNPFTEGDTPSHNDQVIESNLDPISS